MSKIDEIDSLIDALGKQLSKCYVRSEFLRCVDEPRYDEREYIYKEQVYSACSCALGYYVGSVYYFSGRVWKVLDRDFLEKAIERSLVSMKVRKGDIRKSMKELLHQSIIGAKRNELGFSPSVIGFENGVWDFGDIDHPVYHDFDDRMPVRSILPYDYDPDAVCPMWSAFLSTLLPKQKIEILQKYLGLGCVDRKRMSHKIEESLWLVGSGANGKSTIGSVVSAVYGADNIVEVGLGNLICGRGDERSRVVSTIVGKTFCWGKEVQAYDVTRYADSFKSLCSGEAQLIRKIGGDPMYSSDIPFMIFNMNQMPKNRMLDDAWMRRLIIIHFRAQVTADDMDRELSVKLEKELSGIRNWMMQGYRKFVADGYSFSATGVTDEERTEYMLDNGQTVKLFMEKGGYRSTFRVGQLDEKPVLVRFQDLFGEYHTWCARFGYEHDTENKFGRELKRLGYKCKHTSLGNIYEVFSSSPVKIALRV